MNYYNLGTPLAALLAAAGLAAWSHSRPHFKTVYVSECADTSKRNRGPLIESEPAPMRDSLIEAGETANDSVSRERVISELEAARSALQAARDHLHQLVARKEEVCVQLEDLVDQEARAQTSEPDSTQDLERYGSAARSGLAVQFEYDQAVDAKAAAETVLRSVRTILSQARVESDELDAEEGAARAELLEAKARFRAAKASVAWWRDQDAASTPVQPW